MLPAELQFVPLFSAQAVNDPINLGRAIERVMCSHWYVLGNEVEAFEKEFADYCGVKFCVGGANGTDALELALRALELGANDQVALVANAGFYGSVAVRAVGAVPVYVDIEPERLTLDPVALERLLQSTRISAVIVTHLYGQVASIKEIVDFDLPPEIRLPRVT